MSDTRETTTAMGQEAGSIKDPKLTLDSEERKIDFSFMEPSLGKGEGDDGTDDAGASAGSVDESMLSDEEKQQVNEFVKQIDVSNVKMAMQNVGGGCAKVEKIRIGLLVGGYSIPAIPTQSTENEGRVGRAGMPYPPTFWISIKLSYHSILRMKYI